MKIITIDLKGVKTLGEVWQKFAIPLNFPDEQKLLNEPIILRGEKIYREKEVPPVETWITFSLDAFWDWFSSSIYDLTKNNQELKLIVKNMSEINKFDTTYPGSHYKGLKKCLDDVNNPKIWEDKPVNFTYELIEDNA